MRCWLALTLTLASAPTLAGGQADIGTISGRISDQTGEALANADVRVSNPDTNIEVFTRSNDAGIYVVRSLCPGQYRLTIEKPGFRTIVLDRLTLAAQDVLGRNFNEYFRSDALEARNWFNPPPEPHPPLRQHYFGGTLGGPIRKNRSFFFFSYEGLRLNQPNSASGAFYTPETRAAVAPVYQPLVNALPLPTGPLQSPGCDNRSTPCLAG